MKTQEQTQAKKFYAIQYAGNKAEVYIFGDIVDERWWEDEVSPNSVVSELKAANATEIDVHINCYGGSVAAGWAIYNTLRATGAKIRTFADGFVCSAALYPFLAGDERYASAMSAFFLHEASTGAWGYADDLRAAAEEAEKLTEIGINAFVERAGMERETVEQLMAAETWLSPEEAVEHGIAHSILHENAEAPEQSALQKIMQCVLQNDEAKQKKTEAQEAVPPKKPEKSLMQTLSGFFM